MSKIKPVELRADYGNYNHNFTLSLNKKTDLEASSSKKASNSMNCAASTAGLNRRPINCGRLKLCIVKPR